jgi:hypothetical protein
MLFTSTISTMAIALALLAPVALAGDFDVKYHGKTGCGDGGGPV